MQSDVKGVEEKQIHGWWIHLERFDGLRIASQAIPLSTESEWHWCSAKKKKNCSPAAKIRPQVKRRDDEEGMENMTSKLLCTQNH
jgi:hypothetical protein